MSDWQERITRETAPAIRAEHDLRYLVAAPLILAGGPWADLGCGNGVAAANALGEARPARAVLVDVQERAAATAARELRIAGADVLAGDLTSAADLARVGDALLAHSGEPVVTCFEVVEHLSTFLPLLQWSTELAREHAATFVLSVPNDAFWSIRNPHHVSCWSEGAFEELRLLLPQEHTLLRQVSLSGSALVSWDETPERHDVAVDTGGEGAIATHFIAAFGPRHGELRRHALAVQTDMVEQRRWERQRENDLALMQRQTGELEATIERQREELAERTVWFQEWRAYIHELERELQRPLSGVSEDELPERTAAGDDADAGAGDGGSEARGDGPPGDARADR